MKNAPVVLCAILLIAQFVWPQNYPATLNVPVTFFDYHSDGSNPDFNPGVVSTNYTAGLRTNMMQDTLDVFGFPLRTVDSAKINLNVGVTKWFRPWNAGDFSFPVYNRPAGTLNHIETVIYDTAYKNITIPDTLLFNYVPGSPGKYSFQSGSFWPLDGRGFGSETTILYNGTTDQSHNYSFSMKMHRTIQYVPGMTLNFGGDDDIWVYINRKLALDLGGIHAPLVDSIRLDTVNASNFGLVNGGVYDMDVFYAERQAPSSNITLTTQIMAACPCLILMSIVPKQDTISAGDSLSITAKLVDDTGGTHPEYDTLVTWTLFPAGTRSSIKTSQGASNVFYAIDAYKWYYVIGRFEDPENPGRILVDTVQVYVKPGPSDHLLIESSPDSTVSLNSDNRLDSLTFSPSTLKDSVYAVLRDKYGNFISHAQLASWVSKDTGVVTVLPTRTSLGEGEIVRKTARNIFTYVVASQVSMKDSVQVILNNTWYSEIQIVVRGTVRIDSLVMRTDQDTAISAIGLRDDSSGIWDDIQVQWSNTPNLTFNNSAPTGCSWTFRPTNSGSRGKIFIVLGTGSQQLTDTIFVEFSCCVCERMYLLTPPEQRIAGDTILAVMEIDGCFHDTVCASVSYQDVLGTGGSGMPGPTVITSADTATMGSTIYQCFQNRFGEGYIFHSIDTIKFVLYYAPFNADSMHNITMKMSGVIEDLGPFHLYPGALSKIAIEDISGNNVDSTNLFYPTGSKTLVTVGYDKYGNKRGTESCNWSTSDTLHPIANATGISQIFFETASITNDEAGYIKANAIGAGGITVSDSVYVAITGPGAVLPGFSKPLPPKLRIIIPNAGTHIFALPADVAHSRLGFALRQDCLQNGRH
jgi:fibro-slime domain-containing protein